MGAWKETYTFIGADEGQSFASERTGWFKRKAFTIQVKNI